MFFSSIDYDSFCALYLSNDPSVKQSGCSFTYTINSGGWLEDVRFSIETGGEVYYVHCAMDDFGAAEVDIPEEFFEAKVLE